MANIRFIKIDSSDQVTDYISGKISSHLNEKQRVLWLIAGGSAMEIAVLAANALQKNANLNLLSITLTDERYGPVGHTDSNWRQLQDKGFKLKGATLLPVLIDQDFKTTAHAYSKFLNQEMKDADYSIALAGMGPDGHIFGIKPHSPAVNTKESVIAYDWDDYRRLTPTFNLINRLSEVVLFAIGSEKHPQLDMLKKDLNPQYQPAQLLKQLAKVTIFNDYKEEEL